MCNNCNNSSCSGCNQQCYQFPPPPGPPGQVGPVGPGPTGPTGPIALGPTGPTGPMGAGGTPAYGQVYSSVDLQTLGRENPVPWTSVQGQNGVSLSSPTEIQVSEPGAYHIVWQVTIIQDPG